MSLYRASVLDVDNRVAVSRTADSIDGLARLLIGLGHSTSDPWAKPFLDEYGEFTVEVTAEQGRPLNVYEQEMLDGNLQALGAVSPGSDEAVGLLRWHNPERQT